MRVAENMPTLCQPKRHLRRSNTIGREWQIADCTRNKLPNTVFVAVVRAFVFVWVGHRFPFSRAPDVTTQSQITRRLPLTELTSKGEDVKLEAWRPLCVNNVKKEKWSRAALYQVSAQRHDWDLNFNQNDTIKQSRYPKNIGARTKYQRLNFEYSITARGGGLHSFCWEQT